MFNQTQAFRRYLKKREETIDLEKVREAQSRKLFNEKTFYRAFTEDLLSAQKEAIIYSPFVSKFRADYFKPIIAKLRKRNVEIFIFTRPTDEYDSLMQPQIKAALDRFEERGVNVFYLPGSIHEKAAIIDRQILWEGSLNILSQRASKEIMRRMPDENSAMQIISYLGLNKKLQEGYKLRYEKLCRNLLDESKQNLKQKIRIFLLGLLVPVIIWWTIFFTRAIISLFRL